MWKAKVIESRWVGANAADTFISKTTRLYKDSRTLTQGAGPSAPPSQLDQLNDNLKDVTRIMTKNMEDLLWRGDSLDREYLLIASLQGILVNIPRRTTVSVHFAAFYCFARGPVIWAQA
jgi:hypothetical protein